METFKSFAKVSVSRTCEETQVSTSFHLKQIFEGDPCGMTRPFRVVAERGNCIKVSVSGVIPPDGPPISHRFHAVSGCAGGEGGVWIVSQPGSGGMSRSVVSPALSCNNKQRKRRKRKMCEGPRWSFLCSPWVEAQRLHGSSLNLLTCTQNNNNGEKNALSVH